MHEGLENKNVGYRGPFLERAGEHAGEMIEILMAPPERELSPEEKQEVYDYEHNLAKTELNNNITIESLIRNWKGEDLVAPRLFVEPFLEGEIESDEIELPSFQDAEEVKKFFAELAERENIDKKYLRSLINKSRTAYVDKMADALVEGRDLDESSLDSMPVVLNASEAVDAMQNVMVACNVIRVEREKYWDENDGSVTGGKRALLDVYDGAINNLVASEIPIINYLVEQTKLTNDDKLREKALSAVPEGFRKRIEQGNTERMYLLLDYLRNGMGEGMDGKFSRVSKYVSESIGKISEKKTQQEGLLSPEAVLNLKSKKISPDEMKEHTENILRRAGKLTKDENSDYEDRDGRPADELFQVIINPGKSTFAVDGNKGLFKVASTERSVWDAIVVGGAHELTHVNQSESDKKLESVLAIASIKGRRTSIIRESGADASERAMQAKLSGRSKEYRQAFARAIEARERGGSIMDMANAFYEERRKTDPDASDHDNAEAAAISVLRLVRAGGIDSASMAYAEEAMLLDQISTLPETVRTRATAITGLDLADQIKLHRYGLLPEVQPSSIDWSPYILEEYSNYFEELP